MSYAKNCCQNCQNWNLVQMVSYEVGKMAPCSKLSGKQSPLNTETKVYSLHFRGENSSQSIFTRDSFYCNQYKKIG